MQEYHSKKFLSTPEEGAIIKEIDDRPCSVEAESVTVDDNKNIANPCIVGVSKLDRYKLCLRCKARVEPGCSNLGCCSKPAAICCSGMMYVQTMYQHSCCLIVEAMQP